MENFYHHKIEDYLLGELEGNELIAFENALQSDPSLAKSVAQHREMMQRLDALRIRNKVKSATAPQSTKSVARSSNRMLWAIAASLTLLVAAIWWINQTEQTPPAIIETQPPIVQPDAPQTPSEEIKRTLPPQPKEKAKEKQQWVALAREYQENPTQTLVRDAAQAEGDRSPQTRSQKAFEAFYNQNFSLASELLKDDKMVQEDEVARYIRANARFNIGQFASAAHDFDALEGSFQFKHEARWNFLLCQIALGNMKTTKALLAEMVAEEDFPFRAKALELNEKLDGF